MCTRGFHLREMSLCESWLSMENWNQKLTLTQAHRTEMKSARTPFPAEVVDAALFLPFMLRPH
jgi:hypothetical protein